MSSSEDFATAQIEQADRPALMMNDPTVWSHGTNCRQIIEQHRCNAQCHPNCGDPEALDCVHSESSALDVRRLFSGDLEVR
jgi:hypothetical protein